jgi:cell division septation protein DedD
VELPVSVAPVVSTVDAEAASGLSEFLSESADDPASQSTPWRKLAGVAAAALVALTATLAGSMWYLSAQTIDTGQVTELLPPPPRPRVGETLVPVAADATAPGEPTDSAIPASADRTLTEDYVIQVASFKGRSAALRSVEELKSAGYRARAEEVFLGSDRWIQVLVGGYSSAIDVERDLQRVRELPGGYTDARLLER